MRQKHYILALLLLLGLPIWAQEAEQKQPVHLINLYGKVGYDAMFDNLPLMDAAATGAESVFSSKNLLGGAGAGLGVGYELEFGHFRLNAGLEFEWLNSSTRYNFIADRNLTITPSQTPAFDATARYACYNYKETRNLGYVNLPITLGAQFDRYFFMLGAKVGYGFPFSYRAKGAYDLTLQDEALYAPLSIGNYAIQDKGQLKLRQPNVALLAEFGIDLDEWLQAAPDKRNRKHVKPGERLPFGKEYIHYKVSVFAEYGVLNANALSGTQPLAFSGDPVTTTTPAEIGEALKPTSTASVLGYGEGSKLNNLLVGLKFTMSFEIPGRTERPTPPPPSYVDVRVVDSRTNEVIPFSMIRIKNTNTGKLAVKTKSLKKGEQHQRIGVGNFELTATARDYDGETVAFELPEAGAVVPLTVRLRHKPVLHVQVVNAQTGEPIATQVELYKRDSEDLLFTLNTDSIHGETSQQLEDTVLYSVRVEQIGFEAYSAPVTKPNSVMVVKLNPIKKGDKFIVKNLFFATNQTRILPTSEEALNELYQYLDQNQGIHIRIVGHTDNVGSDASNMTLSEGRANAVMADLIERGIAPERLQAEGRGETQPIDTNDTDEGRQNNRRVEIEIEEMY